MAGGTREWFKSRASARPGDHRGPVTIHAKPVSPVSKTVETHPAPSADASPPPVAGDGNIAWPVTGARQFESRTRGVWRPRCAFSRPVYLGSDDE